MQTLLNNVLYIAIAAYGICFLFKIYEGFVQYKNPVVVKSETKETNEQQVTVLFTEVKEADYAVELINPAAKPYNKVTVAEMKAYIKEQQLESEVVKLIGTKLYKARKNDYYQALQAM